MQVKTHSVEKVPRQLYGSIRQALELIRDKIRSFVKRLLNVLRTNEWKKYFFFHKISGMLRFSTIIPLHVPATQISAKTVFVNWKETSSPRLHDAAEFCYNASQGIWNKHCTCMRMYAYMVTWTQSINNNSFHASNKTAHSYITAQKCSQ